MRHGPFFLTLALLATLVLTPQLSYGQPTPGGAPPDEAAASTAPAATAPTVAQPAVPVAAVPEPSTAPSSSPAIVEPAQPSVPPPPGLGSQLLSGVLGYAIQLVGLVLLGLLGWAAAVVKKKWNIDVGVAKDSALRCAVRRVIAYVEEMAAKASKAGEASPDKLKWATELLMQQLPGLLPADLQRMIHEELGLMDGVGASGDPAAKAGV
jgi:hypothetical protein